MTRLLLDGLRAPDAVFSNAGWGALVMTAIVVLGSLVLVPALREANGLLLVAAGTGLQLLFTLVLAGLRQRHGA